MNETLRTGAIGLGAMGRGMATNLYDAGLLGAVWNRTLTRAEEFVAERNISVADSPASLAAAVDVILICVSADQDVEEVYSSMTPGLRAGHVIIDCSTISVDTTRSLARRAEQQGVHWLDAPVSGGVEGARSGALSIMAGGDEQAFNAVTPVWEAIGRQAIYMGASGAGQATKAVNQIIAAGINQAVCQGMAFAQAMELDLKKVVDVISRGAAGSWFMQNRGLNMQAGSYPPGFRVDLHQKDLQICKEMAAAKGLILSTITETMQDYSGLINAGYGGEDISALFRKFDPHK